MLAAYEDLIITIICSVGVWSASNNTLMFFSWLTYNDGIFLLKEPYTAVTVDILLNT